MISEIDPTQDFDKLCAPTDAEIEALTQRVTPAARARLEDAARGLMVAKMVTKNTTPWRELVAAYRASEPVRAEVEVVDHEGVPRVQVTYTERGFGLVGVAGRVHACTGDLVRALDLIEKERETNVLNGDAGGRPSREDDVRACLDIAIQRHTVKKMMEHPLSWIVQRVRVAWMDQHAVDDPPPADNTIRRVVKLVFPDHPKLKKKKCRNPGS